MKQYITCCLFLLVHCAGFAQCADCIPDGGCTSPDGLPAICPQELPSAQAGVYYEEAITFFIPSEVYDPEFDVTVSITALQVNSVIGLPFGMAHTLNDEDAIYHPSEGDNLGCATICGTPMLPGIYEVSINVTATVVAFGITVQQDRSFTVVMVVEEGEGGTETFTYDQLAGCGELDVLFEPTVSGVAPQQTTYNWNFGNGLTLSGPGPHLVHYAGVGDYEVSLQTIISNVVLTQIAVTALDPNWTGDIDDFFGSADPYFEVYDGQGAKVYTSSVLSNTTSGVWNDLSVVLSNPPYTVKFMDDDDVSAIDSLGSTTIDPVMGVFALSTGTGTVGQVITSFAVVNDITKTATISVFEVPSAAFSVSGNVFTCSTPDLASYQWLLNGQEIENATDCGFVASEGGIYTLVVGNEFGCQSASNPFLYCAPVIPVFDEVEHAVYVADIFSSYQWFLNGEELEGQTDDIVYDPDPGAYSVEVSTSDGCLTMSSVLMVSDEVGITESSAAVLRLHPVPAVNYLQLTGPRNEGKWRIFDYTGRLVLQGFASGFPARIELQGLHPGVYSLLLTGESEVLKARFIKTSD